MPDSIAWNGIATIGTGGAGEPPKYTLTLMSTEATLFESRAPKPDRINAEKLTQDNLARMASHIKNRLGGVVTMGEDEIIVGEVVPSPVDGRPTAVSGAAFLVGEWIVEGYDYAAVSATFRVATLEEREKYDLR
ncbi:hypothetical protein [Mycobacterium phage WXIN]|nr:hypothetical protein [Mycobacterium phage WXIN]